MTSSLFADSTEMPQETLLGSQFGMKWTIVEWASLVTTPVTNDQSYGQAQDTLDASRALRNMTEAYVLPTATTSVLWGVKVDGTTITISGGTISTRAPKTGSSVKTSSGTQAITGIGFTPRLITFQASNAGQCFSTGQAASGSEFCFYMSPTANWQWLNRTDRSIFIDDNGGNVIRASVASYDADWFTLSWTLTGVQTANYSYICFP